jgi:ribosomal protein L19
VEILKSISKFSRYGRLIREMVRVPDDSDVRMQVFEGVLRVRRRYCKDQICWAQFIDLRVNA